MLVKGRSVSSFILLKLCLVAFLIAIIGVSPLFSQQPPPQKLETADETNARIRELAKGIESGSGDYRIGGGDLINIDVFDVPQLSRDVRVTESGFIALPLLPVR